MFWFYIVNTGSILRGGFFRFKTKYIEDFPLPNLNLINKDMINSIDTLVSNIMFSKKIDFSADTSDEDNEIDILVYHLYGLTYDDVLIVDPQTMITREEYEKGEGL